MRKKIRALCRTFAPEFLPARIALYCFGGLPVFLLAFYCAEILVQKYPRRLTPDWQIRLNGRKYRTWFAPDDELGFLGPLNQYRVIRTDDFTFTQETDSYGFPNREPWPERVDIVFLGDSLIIGEGVGIDGQFTTLIDERLTDQRVINLGLAGARVEHQYLVYRRSPFSCLAKYGQDY